MLLRRLCHAWHWESQVYRVCWVAARPANLLCHNVGHAVSPPCDNVTKSRPHRSFCSTASTVSTRLPQSLLSKHSALVTSLLDLNVRNGINSRCRWEQKRWSSSDTTKVVPVFIQALQYMDKTAIVCPKGQYTFKDLLHYSSNLAQQICQASKTFLRNDTDERFPLKGETVAFLCGNNMSYVVTLLAIWMCGGIAVPLCTTHPVSELEYFILDSGAKLVISAGKYEPQIRAITGTHGLVHEVLHIDDYTGEYEERETDWFRTLGNIDYGSIPALIVYTSGTTGRPKVLHIDDYNGEYEERETDWFRTLGNIDYGSIPALIVYISGTTGRPKGAVHTFGSLDTMMQGMQQAWSWSARDVILHVLPLHHVHGIVNVLLTSLLAGATCVMMTRFDAKQTWQALLESGTAPSVNVFMAVPTIYAKLLEYAQQTQGTSDNILPHNVREILQDKIRLMVSGSSALPEPIMKRWADLTGHTLLERYGMTEIGMALTNPLQGDRVPGAVGRPFPGVSVRIAEFQGDNPDYVTMATADSNETTVTPGMEGNSGELLVKGDNVFREYWNKPKATQESFTQDGWFKTGDTAVVEDGLFRIVGRTSVDVIKSGAYKISALDIERHLLDHPDIRDVAVVGLPDETWGQIIAVVVVPQPGGQVDFDGVKSWARDKMPPYQVPRIFKSLKEMPRNAMGKVNKKDLAANVFPEYL